MYKTRSTELPERIRTLARVRNAFAATACAAVFLGLLSSLDAISERFFAPENQASVLAARPFSLTGSLPINTTVTAPRLLTRLEPETTQVLVEKFSVVESFFGGAPQWEATLLVVPPASPGVYQLSLTLADAGWAMPIGQTRLDLFTSKDALDEQSRSFLLRRLGIGPIDAALALLALAVFFGALFGLSRRWHATALVERGYLKVYHTKDAGDDTLLYCADPKKVLEIERTYPVLSAAGQFLGTADVSEAGGRYCVLRLYAARARAGCLVSLGIPYNAARP